MPISSTERATGILRIGELSKHFFQLRALDGVSLELEQGEILGLIGPNGSGKSTFINVATGVLTPTSGTIRVGDTDLTRFKPHQLARRGLARTFQMVRLFGSLSVIDNITVAALSVGMRRREARNEALSLLQRFELDRWSDAPADSLPYGHERLVEVVRALAMRPNFLFLDEPAAGLDEHESEYLLTRLQALPGERELGLLIVEHDMRLMMRLCQRLHVLNYGRTIAAGTPEEIRNHPEVIEAYLGTDSSAAA